jgi:hypothetical protein
MRQLLILLIISNCVYGQIYGLELRNQSPAHGSARNFNEVDWDGVSHVLSELECDNTTYSYVFHAEHDFRLFRKENEKFIELANLSKARMGSYAKLLHVYEDSKAINIFSWVYNGYNFLSLKKIEGQPNQPNQLVRHVLISNLNHCMLGDDPSIRSITFEGSNQMKIIKAPSEQYPETELLFEIRPDGVYRNGIWDRTVMDDEDSSVIDEKLKTDPNYFEKLRQAREARLANDPQLKAQTKQPGEVSPTPPPQVIPETKPTSIATAPSLPKPVTPAAVPVMTQNLISWLAGLVGLLVILLGYLGWRYFRNKARP